MISHEAAHDDIEENETGKSTDIHLIEEARGDDMVPLGDSKQIYDDQSTSEGKQAVQKFRKSARNGLQQQEKKTG
jgi:hypothetical protein